MKRKLLSIVPAVLVIASASLVTAPAQSGNASVSGTVRDPSGAVVPDARVIMSDGKGQEIVRTNEVGRYEFSGVPNGKYSLTVQQPGFRAFNQGDVIVGAGAASRLDVTLDIGSISERLEVTAQGQARPQNETHLSSFSYSVNRQEVKPAQAETRQSERTVGPGRTRIRVGGNIRPARLLKHVRPAYPTHLVANGVEGTVLLQAVVGTNGEMLSVEARNSHVDPDLIKAAIEAVRQWRYEPTLLNGQAVEVVTSVTVDFRLKP